MRKFIKYPSDYVAAASETSGAAMRKQKRAFAQAAKTGAKLLATDGEWELYTPENFESSAYLARLGGDMARWSTAASNGQYYFDAYNKNGPLYIFVNKVTGEKYQSHPASASWFYDANDRELGKAALVDFCCEHPAFAKFFDIECEGVEACGDINASTEVDAATKTKYDAVRKLLGEDEWYYIEEYILNGDGKHSLEDIIYDENAWDDYCDWKMKKFHKKAVLSAATRIMAKKIFASKNI